MGLRPLGPVWLRRLSAITGQVVVHASGSGTYKFNFTTADHIHGTYDLKADRWSIDDPQECRFASCRELFDQTIDRPPGEGGH